MADVYRVEAKVGNESVHYADYTASEVANWIIANGATIVLYPDREFRIEFAREN